MRKIEFQKLQEYISCLEDVHSSLQKMQDDEHVKFDNLPESLQYSSRGEEFENIIECLGDAVTGVEDAIDAIEQITNRK